MCEVKDGRKQDRGGKKIGRGVCVSVCVCSMLECKQKGIVGNISASVPSACFCSTLLSLACISGAAIIFTTLYVCSCINVFVN